MFRAFLRYLKTVIRHIHHTLVHSVYFMSCHYGIALPLFRLETVEGYAAVHLLESTDCVPFTPQGFHGFGGVGEISP